MSKRKQFIGQVGLATLGSFFPVDLCKGFDSPEGLVVYPDDGETIMLREGTSLVKIKVARTNGYESMSFLASTLPPGDIIPIHKHLNEDEIIFFHEGTGILTVGEKEYSIIPDLVAMVPKGVWHGIQNAGKEPIQMRFVYSPAGFEGYFREVGTPEGKPFIKRSLEERKPIAKKWGMIFKT
ncbi:cupin domain-containing protein [Flavihumibacter sp. R14]|nr:cupin domain-containing protein [Flavihumibacter soli]